MNFEWKGVFPALLTPFNGQDKLDLPLFEKNLEAQMAAGIDGIILGGTLGEASVLSFGEKEQLAKFALGMAKGRLPVVLNIAEGSTKVAIQMAEDARRWGVDGLMLLPPMRYYSDRRETISFFKSIAASTDLPIMIYNNPIDYKVLVTVEMFEELASCSNIGAVKESTRDLSNITRMISCFGDRFKILCGVDTLALDGLLMGADGWVAGLCDAFPAETVAIYRLVKAGKMEDASLLFRWFTPLLELDIHPKLVQYIKLAASITGIGSEHVRPPRLPLIGEEREQIVQVIREGIRSRPLLPDYFGFKPFHSFHG